MNQKKLVPYTFKIRHVYKHLHLKYKNLNSGVYQNTANDEPNSLAVLTYITFLQIWFVFPHNWL